MRSRTKYALALLVLLIVLGTHISEIFDTWDDTLLTGNDIELNVTVAALSVGACAILIRLLFRLFVNAVATVRSSVLQRLPVSSGSIYEIQRILLYSSPPPLRI
jgi:hypothetical protein